MTHTLVFKKSLASTEFIAAMKAAGLDKSKARQGLTPADARALWLRVVELPGYTPEAAFLRASQ